MQRVKLSRLSWFVGFSIGLMALIAILSFALPSLAEPLSWGRVYTVTCSTTSGGTTMIATSGRTPSGAFKIRNEGSVTLYIGAPGEVDASTSGWAIAPGATESIDSPPRIWACVTGSSTAAARVMGGSL